MPASRHNVMDEIILDSTHALIKYVRHILQTRITFSAHPDIDPTLPTIFCANHFTRLETFMLPSVIYENLGIYARSLGDASLFATKLGRYLTKLGTLSTQDPKRNATIMQSLLSGQDAWIIYPEARMVKNKKIILKEGSFFTQKEEALLPMRTGAAFFALHAQLEKEAFFKAQKEGDFEFIESVLRTSQLQAWRFSDKPVQIVPITIGYFPLRTGENLVSKAAKFITQEDFPTAEELEIEGNILAGGAIDVYCGAPILAPEVLYRARREIGLFDQAPSNRQKLLDHAIKPLTASIMAHIYAKTLVHFDHLFALVLAHAPSQTLSVKELKIALFLCAQKVHKNKLFRLHGHLKKDLYKLLCDEPFELFDSIMRLALAQKILLSQDDGTLFIDTKALHTEDAFGTVRIKNTLLVYLNEIALLPEVAHAVVEVLAQNSREQAMSAMHTVYEMDVRLFDKAYKRTYTILQSKPKSVGTPRLLFNPQFTKGMVISHGYKAAPKEMEPLALHMHAQGFNVYTTRMQGHGTSPLDLKNSTYLGWLEGFNRGYAALSCISEELYVCGFSAGGLLALSTAASKTRPIAGLVCINSAIAIDDVRFNYLMPALDAVTHILSVIDSDIEYLQDTPENPHINYSEHPVSAVRELKNLIDHTKPLLEHITTPILIIQGTHDPVVAPEGAQFIYDTIASTQKTLVKIEANEHVIVTSPHKEAVFNAIDTFLTNQTSSNKGAHND